MSRQRLDNAMSNRSSRLVEVDRPAEQVATSDPTRQQDIDQLVRRCPKLDVAVHVGSGARRNCLALTFAEVWAFEHDLDRFMDSLSFGKRPNTYLVLAMLGDRRGIVTYPRDHERVASVPMLRIDDLNLEALDAVVIDDPASRDAVIAGAAQTLRKFDPIVLIGRSQNQIAKAETCLLR